MLWRRELQVGDIIYVSRYRDYEGKTVIEKVTKTTAITKDGVKLKRMAHDNGYCPKVGATAWDNTTYRLENETIRAEYNLHCLKLAIKKKMDRIKPFIEDVNWVDGNNIYSKLSEIESILGIEIIIKPTD